MKNSQEVVKKNDGREWSFTCPMPETLEEGVSAFGETGVFELFVAQLKVKYQNIARSMFDAGKTPEEVEEAIRKWKPGEGNKKSKREQALTLIMDKSDLLEEDQDLKTRIRASFMGGKFQEVIDELEKI